MDLTKLSAETVENLVKEVASHQHMKHPHIVEMIDYMREGNYLCLLLDYAAQGNSFELMSKGDLDVATCCKIFTQTALAIEYIHSKGYIHRDIKPENILLDGNGNVLLSDFGWTSAMTDTHYLMQPAGTYEYMSPEALCEKQQDKGVDVWALGVLLYELHHNKEPFPGRTPKEVLVEIKKKSLSFFSDVPQEAIKLISKMMAIESQKRPSLREILESPYIKKFYSGVVPPAPVESHIPNPVISSGPAKPVSAPTNSAPVKTIVQGGSYTRAAPAGYTPQQGSTGNPVSVSSGNPQVITKVVQGGSYTPGVATSGQPTTIRVGADGSKTSGTVISGASYTPSTQIYTPTTTTAGSYQPATTVTSNKPALAPLQLGQGSGENIGSYSGSSPTRIISQGAPIS